MKTHFLKVFAIVFLSFLVWNSCGNKKVESTEETIETKAEEGIEFTSTYICPMHCKGSGSEEEGSCPVCKMDYVLNENHDHEGHDDHNHDH